MKHSTGFLVFCLLLTFIFAFWGGGWYQGVKWRSIEKIYLIEGAARDRMVIDVGKDRDKKMNELKRLKHERGC